MTKIVGVYLRVSDDAEETREAVVRQHQDVLNICARNGWTAKKYEDNDLSAFKRDVVRPDFERLLLDLAAGRIDGIVTYNLDRLARQPRDLERLLDVYADRPGLVFVTCQGSVDLSSDDGLAMARVMVTFANKASADTARRVKRKHLDLAEKGIPVGGTRPFGWQADKLTLLADEARIAREGIDRVLAGLSPRALAQEWNDAGVLTTRGKSWSGKTVRQYLLNPRLAGFRDHKGKPQFDATGARRKGTWEPLVSVDTFERLQRILVQEERRAHIPRKGALQYLLSGVARCGVCGSVMYGNSRGPRPGLWYYVCSEADGHTLSVSGRATDSLIEDLVVSHLLNVGSVPVDAPEWQGRARQAEAKALLAETMEAYRNGNLDGSIAFPTATELKDELATLERDRRAWLNTHSGPSTVDLTREDWDALHMDEKRAIIQSFFSAIVVREATRKSNRLDPARLEPVPRSAA